MLRTLYLDCFAGISGNMFLGALIDLGLPESRLREELAKLPVGGYSLVVKRVLKQGISAVYVDVKVGEDKHHRHLSDIFRIIDGAALDQPVKDASKQVFSRLAAAEAKVHGTTAEEVHFHEVGAVDAIVDIVGTVIGLNFLGINRIYTSKLQTGRGFINAAHGRMPIPAPATAELLQGIPYDSGDISRELVTPTGAALVSVLSSGHGAMPLDFMSEVVGYGAGTWDLEIPNTLRAILGPNGTAVGTMEKLVIEANIDDLNPQLYPYVLEKCLAAGAADAWLTPIIMKKGRPAVKVSVLVDSGLREDIVQILLSETSTIGLRFYSVNRIVAAREMVTVKTAWGSVGVKLSRQQGAVYNVAPEFEDCRRLAEAKSLPLKVVWQEAMSIAWQTFGQTEDNTGELKSGR